MTLPDFPSISRRSALSVALLLAAGAGAPALAQDEGATAPKYPVTEFADDAKSASVTAGGVTATVSQEMRPEFDADMEVPVLEVTVDGESVLVVPGVPSGFQFVAAEAAIAEIDPDNAFPEVYFSSYSGGAHCCNTVIVATEVAGRWVAVTVGEFDGDGNYLDDADGDGLAEIVTVDNRFLYAFDCYACSTAPLTMTTIRDGKTVDVSAEPRFLPAHRNWLETIEGHVDPQEKWTSPGFLAGWVAARIRVGEGEAAWQQLSANWNTAADEGEEVCISGEPLDNCADGSRAVLPFPERLKLFLEEAGYTF